MNKNTNFKQGFFGFFYIYCIFLLQIKAAESEDVVGIEFFAEFFVDIFGLPGADVDLGLLGVAEIPHHKHVALIAVAVGVPLLQHSNAIHTPFCGMLNDFEVIEFNFDVFGVVESLLEAAKVFLFGLLEILDVRAGWNHLVAFALHHTTGDDEGVVGENLLEEIDVFLVVCCAELFHEIDNLHAVVDVSNLVVGVLHPLLHHFREKFGVDGE